jgi:hypothetical protein
MPAYRVELWEAGGNKARVIEIHCASDDEAIDAAGSINHPHAITVWEDERQVAHFTALPDRWV